MAKLALKLWSTNKQYVQEAVELFEQAYYDFIELYAVPGSFEEVGNMWKQLKIPYVIHAPHQGIDVINFAEKELFEQNKKTFYEVQRFADLLEASYIVVHPGVAGTEEEIIHQLSFIQDSRILIENMPYASVAPPGLVCQGYGYDFLKKLTKLYGFGFCLDIAHAFCSANSFERDPYLFVKELQNLKPSLYHFSDLDANSILDKHMHFGHGGIDFGKIFEIVLTDLPISLETEKSYKDSLRDFKDDVNFLRKFDHLK